MSDQTAASQRRLIGSAIEAGIDLPWPIVEVVCTLRELDGHIAAYTPMATPDGAEELLVDEAFAIFLDDGRDDALGHVWGTVNERGEGAQYAMFLRVLRGLRDRLRSRLSQLLIEHSDDIPTEATVRGKLAEVRASGPEPANVG